MMLTELGRAVGILTVLGWNSWTDIRRRQVSLWTVFLLAGAGICFRLCGVLSTESLLAVCFGAMFPLVSLLTKGSLGMGDGLLILSLGLVMETGEMLGTILAGMLCSAGMAGVLLVFFKKGRHTEIPLVPFLLVGYLVLGRRW